MINGEGYIKITVNDKGSELDYSGDATNLLKGLAAAATLIIGEVPEAFQQKFRADFIHFINEATVGNLFGEDANETT